MVWLVGFEPTASSSRTKRAAKLRHNQSVNVVWSGWPGSNRRPLVPQTSALPDCATARQIDWCAGKDSNLRSPMDAWVTTRCNCPLCHRRATSNWLGEADSNRHWRDQNPLCCHYTIPHRWSPAPEPNRQPPHYKSGALLVELARQVRGGSDGNRTRGLRNAIPALSQLSYTPVEPPTGAEPVTFRLPCGRSPTELRRQIEARRRIELRLRTHETRAPNHGPREEVTVVEVAGVEPATLCLQSRRSTD